MQQEDLFVAEPVIDMAQYRSRSTTSDEDAIIAEALRILEERLQDRRDKSGVLLSAPWMAKDFIKLKLAEREREVFAALFLDVHCRLIAYEEMFFGTVHSAPVHPREIVKRALELNAVTVIVAHNHPSGITLPSRADEEMTERIKQALKAVEIKLLDHFVVGEGKPFSFAGSGRL